MRIYRLIITGLLLSLVTMTAIAQEGLSMQGCRRGTPRPESSHLRRGAAEGRTPGGDFYHGERHQLTVLVAFNDRTFVGDEAATLEIWNKFLNGKEFYEEPFKGSVHDYFYDQSYGEFNVIFDLIYVQVDDNAKKYASTYRDDENSQYLVEDVVDILKQNPEIDWGRYDWNGDGYINQLLIIYAGVGMSDVGGTDRIWPHQWWMSEHKKDVQEDIYADPIVVSSGDKDYLVDCYCASAEIRSNESYGTFGTICHEFTHCFGFPDFYYGGTKTVDAWDLMDNGNLVADGFQPVGYSAHERWLMGWLEPIELKRSTSVVDMPALADKGRAYLIRNDGWENEFYMVENRQPLGWDASLPSSGLVIFHIDFDPAAWTSTKASPNSYDRKRYDIFHASNERYPIENWPYPYQDNNSLTNTSIPASTLNNPNLDGTKFMSKPITDIRFDHGLASFEFTVETTGLNEVTTGSDQLLYRFGTIDFVRDANGNIRKIIRK